MCFLETLGRMHNIASLKITKKKSDTNRKETFINYAKYELRNIFYQR